MNLGKLAWHASGLGTALSGCLLAMACAAPAQELRLDGAGARFGFNPSGAADDFHQADLFVDWDLPWNWDLGSAWRLKSRMDVSAGWLGESGINGGIFSAGPSLVLAKPDFPLSLECGVSPALLTRIDFRSKDFGDVFQFTSHVGLNFDVSSHFQLGYRFQHMSNAGLSRHNPGLNLHLVGLSYLF